MLKWQLSLNIILFYFYRTSVPENKRSTFMKSWNLDSITWMLCNFCLKYFILFVTVLNNQEPILNLLLDTGPEYNLRNLSFAWILIDNSTRLIKIKHFVFLMFEMTQQKTYLDYFWPTGAEERRRGTPRSALCRCRSCFGFRGNREDKKIPESTRGRRPCCFGMTSPRPESKQRHFRDWNRDYTGLIKNKTKPCLT